MSLIIWRDLKNRSLSLKFLFRFRELPNCYLKPLCNLLQHLRTQYDELFPALYHARPDIFPPDLYTWENFLWACELWYSNSMKVMFPNGRFQTCLVPIAGFLNHSVCLNLAFIVLISTFICKIKTYSLRVKIVTLESCCHCLHRGRATHRPAYAVAHYENSKNILLCIFLWTIHQFALFPSRNLVIVASGEVLYELEFVRYQCYLPMHCGFMKTCMTLEFILLYI